MDIIRFQDGITPLNFISIIKNDTVQQHFYYRTLNFLFYNQNNFLFDLDVDDQFISDIRSVLEQKIHRRYYFLAHDSFDFKIVTVGRTLVNLFDGSNLQTNFIDFNNEKFIPSFNIIRQEKNGFADFSSSYFSEYKSLYDLNFSDIEDYKIRVDNAVKEFDNTLNNMLFYNEWKTFQNETNLDLKNYRKVSALIRPFKIKNFLDSQENNLIHE